MNLLNPTLNDFAAAAGLSPTDPPPAASVLDRLPSGVGYMVNAAALAWFNAGGDAASFSTYKSALCVRIEELTKESDK